MGTTLRSNFIEIAEHWEGYGESVITKAGASIKVIDTKDTLYSTITETLPSNLSFINASKPYQDLLLTKGSAGEGNKSLAPWIATFNTDITISAKKGFYVVYLFSADLKHLFLSIAFGVTSFENLFGRGEKALIALRSAAEKKRNLAVSLIDRTLNENIKDRLIVKPIDVACGNKSFLHKAYGEGSIFSLEYNLDDLPDTATLEEDYQNILELYFNIERDVSIPEVEEFALSEVNEEKKDLTISNFEIREPRKTTKKSGNTGPSEKRRSKKSNLVGNEAEELVFKYEQKKVLDLGIPDKKVIWCAKNPKDRKPGYDVLSFNEKGEEIYIEVKGTEGKKITSVNLTANEWRVANLSSHKDNYFIYLVYETLTKPKIEVITNPASMVEDGNLEIKVSDYDLRLNSLSS